MFLLFLTVIYFVTCVSVESSLQLCYICCFDMPNLNIQYDAKSIATCKKIPRYNQPKPYFFKKLL